MNKGKTIFLWTACLIMTATSCGHGQKAASTALSSEGQKVVGYLLADWQERFRSTTIPHAMANLGMKTSDDLRLEVIRHLRNNPELARNIRFWGANNYLLTNEERRIAKYLLNTSRDENRLPDIRELTAVLGGSEKEFRERLAFMAKVGLLATSATEPLGYELSEDAELWGGPLRHNFHTVTIGNEAIFDIW